MEAIPYAWPRTKISTNTLLFAQSICEQYKHSTWDSFRVSSHCTLLKLREVVHLCGLKDRGIPISVDEVWEELSISLKNDPAVASILGKSSNLILSVIDPKANTNAFEKKNAAEFVLDKIKDSYKQKLEELIIEAISNNLGLGLIYNLSRLYGVHLKTIGHADSFIYETANKVFFDIDVKQTGKPIINKFFRCFGFESWFRIYFKLDKSIASIFENTKFTVHKNIDEIPTSDTPLNPSFFNALGKQKIFVSYQCSDFDHWQVKKQTKRLIRFFYSTAKLSNNKLKVGAIDDAIVVRITPPTKKQLKKFKLPLLKTAKNMSGCINNKHIGREGNPLHRRPFFSSQSDLDHFKRTIPAMLFKTESDSQTRLENSILAREAAMRTTNAVQLLSLWSALEVLAPPKSDDTTIIKRITKSMLPAIGVQYLSSKINAIYRLSKEQVPNLNAILEEIDGIEDKLTKFCALIINPELEDLRLEFSNSLGNNPLLGWRLYKLNKTLTTKNNIKSYYNDHIKRVEWQLARIYRARNEFAHNAEHMPSLLSLTLNLDEYYRASFETIIHSLASGNNMNRELNNILMETKFRNDVVIEWLSNSTPPDAETAKNIMSWNI